ncbi:004L [Cherax quadricarinatus iridovirus]|uniref:NTPase n=1 Tax=Shrimp hemocyte iridescent virus TaxID=2039780 RepID=A0A291B0Y1_9VIRU|nr:004L [Cherax quadricarinatus iridovirus]YP_010084898.1 NTPase [Shrimp hemocyte iridescent virus]UPA43325.1 NTPase [Iridovirus CN01]ASZ84984.1 004L [Cherax quadricarinatus iridovirus]ATE87155.1 NTPase [Shrimp hemocyte iridescent virus]UPA43560.1 NTPase [Iridovirus CN01]UPA43595.1 NTPase [Iridovirus CN01]
MNLENFLPKYPNIIKSSYPILNPYNDENFNDAIVSKREFESLKIPKTEKIIQKGTGEEYNHQKIIARFLSSNTPYDSLLLFYEMGTGKTCTAVSAIEKLRYEKKSHIKRAIVCARGGGLLKNFTQELLFSCTDGKYIPENYDMLSDLERIHRTKKITSKFYDFYTFEILAKELSKLPDDAIVKKFSNTIFVIDEVHNLREKSENIDDDEKAEDEDVVKNVFEKKNPLLIYKQFHRLFHLIRESKILLMSGTVMKDDPSEFASIMNLILPSDKQFPIDKEFMKRYFNSNSLLKTEMIPSLHEKIRGKISYLKAMTSSVKKVFIGRSIGNLTNFIVYPNKMSNFQTEHYINAYRRDERDRGIYINSRQASLFVFPDGSYGTDGFNKYIIERKPGENRLQNLYGVKRKSQKNTFTLSRDLEREIGKSLSNLSKFSEKYAETIKILLQDKTKKSLIYSEYVHGGGCILFSKILELFGYSQAKGDEKSRGLRYAILTNKTTSQNQIQKINELFNSDANAHGEYISVIIGSRLISEGFTFKNVTNEFIFTPFWNYAETSQVIARGWRLGSHDFLIRSGEKNLQVNVFQMVSLPSDNVTTSIDLEMYEISERKDVAMKQIEYEVKRSTFDCPLMIKRNKISGYDDMRECEYKSCNYSCLGNINESMIDYSTYNLFYSRTEIVRAELEKYFRTNFFIEFEDLFRKLPQLTKFEIVESIKYFLDEGIQFYNKFGFLCFIRIYDRTLYISSDVRIPNNDVLSKYYTKNLITSDGDPFELILERLYNENIPVFIEHLFQHPEYLRSNIARLPEFVQILLLSACIQAEMLNIQKNKSVRKQILDYFKGFYGEIKGKWVIWLYKENFDVICFDGNDWVPCENDEPELIAEHLAGKKSTFNQSPIGYYGLHNPQLNEFCLKEVDLDKKKDLRKIAIGRRCTDWNLPILLDIMSRRVQFPYPDGFLSGLTDDMIKDMVARNKYNKPFDSENVENMKRFLYWVKQPRTSMCKFLFGWLKENNLIEENFDCGTQKKQRVKFIQ